MNKNRSNFLKKLFLQQKPLISYDPKYLNDTQSDINQEQDKQFVHKIRQIAQFLRIRNNDEFSQRRELTLEEISLIQQKAIIHSEANIINSTTEEQFKKIPKQNQCSCGCSKGRGQPLSIFTSIHNLTFLGPTVLLFLSFLSRLLIILTIIILVYNVYAILSNIFGSQKSYNCDNALVQFWCVLKLYTSIDRKKLDGALNIVQLWLGFIFCLIWIVGIRIILKLSRINNDQIDAKLNSSSDYCIMLDNLPYSDIQQEQVLTYLQKVWQSGKRKNEEFKEKLSIRGIQIIYRTDEIRKNISQLKDKILQINELLEPNQFKILQGKNSKYYELKKEIIQINDQLDKMRERFISDGQYRRKFATTCCLVQFAKTKQQNLLLKQFGSRKKTTLSKLKAWLRDKCREQQRVPLLKNQKIKITRSPQPSDLNWSGCQVQYSFWRVLVVWLMLVVIVCISFGCLMGIRELRKAFPVLKNFALLISVSLNLFNRIIWNALVNVINIQKNNTKSDDVISIMNKSSVSQAFNTIILPIILNIVIQYNVKGPNGLVSQAFDFHIIVFIMMLNYNLINFPYQIKRLLLCIPPIKRFIIQKKSKVVGQVDNVDDYRQVLSYYEGPAYPIAGAYVYVNTFVLHGLFYVHLQPCIFFLMIFNIFVFYWVKKYLLLRRCKIPSLIELSVLQTCLNTLMYGPIVYGSGSLLFTVLECQCPESSWILIPSILCIIMGIVSMIDPFDLIDKLATCLIHQFSCFLTIQKQASKITPENVKQMVPLPKFIAQQSQQQIEIPQRQVIQYIIETHYQCSERLECYYKDSNLVKLLNFEMQFTEPEEKLKKILKQNSKIFCQHFTRNYGRHRNNHLIFSEE